jgi:hypothetical protein
MQPPQRRCHLKCCESQTKRRHLNEKIVFCSAAFKQLSPGARQQNRSAKLKSIQRTRNHTRLCRQVEWRLHPDQARSRNDLRATSDRQNKTSPLPRTTSGGNRERVTLNEHKFRRFDQNRGSSLSDVDHNLDQNHREGVPSRTDLALIGGLSTSLLWFGTSRV